MNKVSRIPDFYIENDDENHNVKILSEINFDLKKCIENAKKINKLELLYFINMAKTLCCEMIILEKYDKF